MAGKIAFLVCEHYAKEAQKALSEEKLDDAVAATFPARCGCPPITRKELRAIIESLGDVEHVEVYGASCLKDVADFTLNGCGIHINMLKLCFNLISDPALSDLCLKKGAYLTTPGWLANWPAEMEKLGLDQKTAREMFAETTAGIVLLDTGIDEKSALHLQAFAGYVDRPFEIHCTGIFILRLRFANAVLTWQLEKQKKKCAAEIQNIQKQSSMHAMALDLVANLARIVDETQATEAMLDVYSMLFAPQKLSYLSFQDGLPDKLWIRPLQPDDQETGTIKSKLAAFNQESGYTESGRGFLLRIVRRDEIRGVLSVDEIAFPEYLDQYLNLALGIMNICELPIVNAHKYQKLIQTEGMLRKANEDLFHLATTDSLTGIANRRAYDEYLEVEWKRMLRDHTFLSLIICDIDFFKHYNDLHGHKGGDTCLNTVAKIIRQVASRTGDFVARYGGEEFAVILPNTPAEGALRIAERIRTAIANFNIPHGRSEAAPYVTLSIGVAQVIPQEAKYSSPIVLFRTADAALYEAKRQGRNRTIVHKSVK